MAGSARPANFYRRAQRMHTKVFLMLFVAAFALMLLSDPIFNSLEAKGLATKVTLKSRDVSISALFQFAMFCGSVFP